MIVIPVGRQMGVQYLVMVTKDEEGNIERKDQYPVQFVPMTGKARE
jgi:protein-L-isoaspartate O-methyltransferase